MKLTKLLNQQLTRIGLATVLLSTLNLQLSTAFAQGTAFTYQGRLDSGGAPVNGASDLTFTLYNAATLGATVGTSNVFNDLPVSNGLFTVTLDFGAGAFNGSARWLQIAARPGASTGAYTNLAPRQPVTPTPYAMFAGGASAAGVSGTLSAAQIPTLDAATKLTGTVPDARLSANVALRNAVNQFTAASNTFSGRVGIGTTTPGVALEVNGFAQLDFGSLRLDSGYAIDGKNNAGVYRGCLFPRYNDTTYLAFGTNGFQIQTDTGTPVMNMLPNGNVGIGTLTPGAPLDVLGQMQVGANGTIQSPGSKNSYRGMIETSYGNPADRYGISQGPNGEMALYTAGFFPGSSIQFGLATGADSFSPQMTINHAGNVGIGRTDPGAKLDVNGNIAALGGITVNSGGASSINFNDTVNDAGKSWFLFNNYYGAGNFAIARFDPALGSFPSDRNIFINAAGNVGIGKIDPGTKLDVAGEVTCVAVNLTSDRNAKEDFKPVSSREVLAKVAALPITEWQYKKQGDSRHIGPMAQDFHAAFGTGRDDKHIASVDADGVALAAIQGLNEKLDEKSAEVESLKQSVAELKELVKQLTQPAGR